VGTPPWLDEEEARAWRSFITAQGRLRGRLARQLLSDSGLSEADYEVLVHLSEAPEGALRAFELGRRSAWEKSRLSHHLTRMARRGLVERQPCPTDSRGAFVVLTALGRSAIEQAAPRHVEHVREDFVTAFSRSGLEDLRRLCDRLLAHLDALEQEEGCDGNS
jgi:DNA-binding MarR family transcriptional regulator